MSSDILIVTPCGKKKVEVSSPARSLYKGAYFSACLKWALLVVPSSNIRILSGKYGLLPLERVVDPYNAIIGDVRTSVTVREVLAQAELQGIGSPKRVIVLGGVWYQWVVKNCWPDQAEFPFYSGGGMFDQMEILTINRGLMPERWKRRRVYLNDKDKERSSVAK